MAFRQESARLALVAALPSEGERLLPHLREKKTLSCGALNVLQGRIAELEVLVAFSGLGKINTAAAVATILSNFTVSHLWMWGSAGVYPQISAELTDVALATEEILGDEGVVTLSSWQSLEVIGIPLAETGDGPIFNRIPLDQVELERAQLLLGRWQASLAKNALHRGPFLTVSAVSGSLARASLLGERFGALCENMEGAAAAQVCLSFNVPFLEIRGLSNWAGDRCKLRWRLPDALDNCQRALLCLVESWESV